MPFPLTFKLKYSSKASLSLKMLYSDYLKRRVLAFHAEGLSPAAISDALAHEGLTDTRQGLAKKAVEDYTPSEGHH